ncbi:MAG: hypothetical protein IPP71_13225 [Bacteroidetes bacterium]|nr:hypothetical protein [Bacteroidota bacterium]
MLNSSVFRKSGYHLTMSVIYIAVGIILTVKSLMEPKDYQLTALGGIICAYGCYRLISGLRRRSVSNEN